MIDAAWVPASGGEVYGDTGSSNYTALAWEYGTGKGLTVTPAKGDIGKTLLIPNAGYRGGDGDSSNSGSMGGLLWPTIQYSATSAWYLGFNGTYSVGLIASYDKLYAFSLRCVRS